MRDWGELWLNEEFATYFENVGGSLARPNFAYFASEIKRSLNPVAPPCSGLETW